MTDLSRRHVLVTGVAAVLAGCSVPRNAPMKREVLEGAGEFSEFSVYQVTRASLPRFGAWPVTGREVLSNWPSRNDRKGLPRIAPGDRLSLRIWDAEENSLLTGPGGNVTDMPDMIVSTRGTIFVPYVDEIRVSGLTVDAARSHIQQEVTDVIPSAQVQLNHQSGQGNSVELVSGVAVPGRYPLEAPQTTILGAISAAGGVPGAMRNPQLRLQRQGRVYGISLQEVFDDPAHDIPLWGNDRIIVEEDKRNFIALGASGQQNVIDFDAQQVSALRAISLMGGMADTSADPGGVLVMRQYPRALVGPQGGRPETERVVFSFDLTSADGLFSAGQFPVNSGDVVLATQAPVTTMQKVLSLLGSTIGLGARVSSF
ncbi:polysaccharide export outer membrane protein [Rhodovulum bhavnagarense]|uniref:Polysaccharide export outer membrane protein n=1 Tax=Rhodovulum bhavnagarense TaxID=992286 RepID=A0A4R2RGC9_9RHOB|nr:polysaccharide biosynthesis/export family protein [Rhodovulum bhavnagarense]TCP58681.1 polysaccharide export outer membrane protein [Rhodovulum bhavnagarense]